MLGRRDPQRSLCEAQCWPHQVPADSFYGRMSAVNDELFRDDDLAGMYCEDNGRPSLPPSFMSGVTLLQFYDDVSDEEAVERLCFDLRWKVALNLPLDFVPPHPSSLSVFRRRLLEHGQERYAFNRLIRVGRAAGFLPDKTAFSIHLETRRATCPHGQVASNPKTVRDPQGRPVLLFAFDRSICETCPLFARCVHSKSKGRYLRTHYHEALLQDARQRQHTTEFRDTYLLRVAVERKIATLVQHGLRKARYIGSAKGRLQAQWTGAAVNLARLFTLFKGDTHRMRRALAAAS